MDSIFSRKINFGRFNTSFSAMPRTGPLYRVVAYDAVCSNGTDGFYYVAITQFFIVAFAMIMVTLRFAFKPGVIDDQTMEEQAMIAAPGGVSDDIRVNDAEIHSPVEALPEICDTQEELSSAMKQEEAIEERATAVTPGDGVHDGTNDNLVLQKTEEEIDGQEKLNTTVIQNESRAG